jgi:hypothetical protein
VQGLTSSLPWPLGHHGRASPGPWGSPSRAGAGCTGVARGRSHPAMVRHETRRGSTGRQCDAGKKMEMKKDREGSELTGNEEVAGDGGLNGVDREAMGVSELGQRAEVEDTTTAIARRVGAAAVLLGAERRCIMA